MSIWTDLPDGGKAAREARKATVSHPCYIRVGICTSDGPTGMPYEDIGLFLFDKRIRMPIERNFFVVSAEAEGLIGVRTGCGLRELASRRRSKSTAIRLPLYAVERVKVRHSVPNSGAPWPARIIGFTKIDLAGRTNEAD